MHNSPFHGSVLLLALLSAASSDFSSRWCRSCVTVGPSCGVEPFFSNDLPPTFGFPFAWPLRPPRDRCMINHCNISKEREWAGSCQPLQRLIPASYLGS